MRLKCIFRVFSLFSDMNSSLHLLCQLSYCRPEGTGMPASLSKKVPPSTWELQLWPDNTVLMVPSALNPNQHQKEGQWTASIHTADSSAMGRWRPPAFSISALQPSTACRKCAVLKFACTVVMYQRPGTVTAAALRFYDFTLNIH